MYMYVYYSFVNCHNLIKLITKLADILYMHVQVVPESIKVLENTSS